MPVEIKSVFSTNSTHTVTLPAGIVSGDLIFLFPSTYHSNYNAQLVVGTGLAEVGHQYVVGEYENQGRLYWKRATGNESGTAFTFNVYTAIAHIMGVVVSGVAPDEPTPLLHVTQNALGVTSGNAGDSATLVTTSVPLVQDALSLAFFSTMSGSNSIPTYATPAGMQVVQNLAHFSYYYRTAIYSQPVGPGAYSRALTVTNAYRPAILGFVVYIKTGEPPDPASLLFLAGESSLDLTVEGSLAITDPLTSTAEVMDIEMSASLSLLMLQTATLDVDLEPTATLSIAAPGTATDPYRVLLQSYSGTARNGTVTVPSGVLQNGDTVVLLSSVTPGTIPDPIISGLGVIWKKVYRNQTWGMWVGQITAGSNSLMINYASGTLTGHAFTLSAWRAMEFDRISTTPGGTASPASTGETVLAPGEMMVGGWTASEFPSTTSTGPAIWTEIGRLEAGSGRAVHAVGTTSTSGLSRLDASSNSTSWQGGSVVLRSNNRTAPPAETEAPQLRRPAKALFALPYNVKLARVSVRLVEAPGSDVPLSSTSPDAWWMLYDSSEIGSAGAWAVMTTFGVRLPNNIFMPFNQTLSSGSLITIEYGPGALVTIFEDGQERLNFLTNKPKSLKVRTTITHVSNEHLYTLRVTALFPDGSTYEIPGVNGGETGVEHDIGTWRLDDVRWRFEDLTAGGGAIWTEADLNHIRRTSISGSGWIGYEYRFDDAGGDGDFNDLVAHVKYYTSNVAEQETGVERWQRFMGPYADVGTTGFVVDDVEVQYVLVELLDIEPSSGRVVFSKPNSR